MERLKNEYHEAKEETSTIVKESGNDQERRQLSEIVNREHTFLNSSNPLKVEEAIEHLRRVTFQILRRTPDFLVGWFQHLVSKRESFNDPLQAKTLIEAGKRHVDGEDFDRLGEVNSRLHNLLPQEEKESKEMQHFTGIS